MFASHKDNQEDTFTYFSAQIMQKYFSSWHEALGKVGYQY
jgi:protein involved in sex pheromone biosynthesis